MFLQLGTNSSLKDILVAIERKVDCRLVGGNRNHLNVDRLDVLDGGYVVY